MQISFFFCYVFLQASCKPVREKEAECNVVALCIEQSFKFSISHLGFF